MPAFDYSPPAYTGPSKEEVLRMRKQHLSPGETDTEHVPLPRCTFSYCTTRQIAPHGAVVHLESSRPACTTYQYVYHFESESVLN